MQGITSNSPSQNFRGVFCMSLYVFFAAAAEQKKSRDRFALQKCAEDTRTVFGSFLPQKAQMWIYFIRN